MTPHFTSRRQILAMGLLGLALGAPAWAADSRPLRIVVPFPAGGAGDIAVRMVADGLAAKLGMTVLVDNKPGGNGVIAVQELLRAAPDGHTIMFGTPSALLYAPQLTPKRPPYDPLKDLMPITHFSSFSYFVFVNDQVPVKTLGELIDYVHKHPGKLAYGTGDSSQLVAMAQLVAQAKLDMTHVPYPGSSAAFSDFIGNRVQVMVNGFELVEQSKGKVRPLATLLDRRSPLLPNVPTFQEAGLPPVTTRPWTAFFAPRNTPKPVIDRLAKAFAATFQDPKLQEFFSARGSVLEASTPEAMHQILVEQMPLFAQAIKTFNLARD